MKLYLSGPMTGLKNFNFEEFNDYAKRLREIGYDVVNPAENDNGSRDKPREFYLRKDIKSMLNADGVATLDGHGGSAGALLACNIAQELKIPMHHVLYWLEHPVVHVLTDVKWKGLTFGVHPESAAVETKKGLKFDDDKARMDLISPSTLDALGIVLGYGAKKYGDRNWEQGINYGRVYAGVQRHLIAWWDRECVDRESELPHLWHALCGIMFLVEYEDEIKYKDFDDRP